VKSSEVIQLARPRSGHFDLGTGYHGDLWLDLDALLLLRPSLLRPYVGWLAERLREHSADATIPSGAWPAGLCPLCASGIPFTDPSSAA
jgi:hypothetical protein